MTTQQMDSEKWMEWILELIESADYTPAQRDEALAIYDEMAALEFARLAQAHFDRLGGVLDS